MWFLAILSMLLEFDVFENEPVLFADSKLNELPDPLFMDLVYELEED